MSANDHGTYFSVIKEFNARLGDELTIHPGDTIELISDDSEFDDGWYMGRNLATNSVGLYPKAFTTLLSEQAKGKPSLLRSRSRRLTPSGSPATTTPPAAASKFLRVSEEIGESGANSSGSITQSTYNHTTDSKESDHMSLADRSRDTVTGKYVSVHRTLNDIDKALEELDYDDRSYEKDIIAGSALNPVEVKTWTPEQVTQYFSSLNFDVESTGQFARHKINGAILIQLELSYLKELEIASFGTRFEIYKEIEELRLASENRSYKRKTSSGVSGPKILMPSVNNKQTHARKRSQSLDNIPVSHYVASNSASKSELEVQQTHQPQDMDQLNDTTAYDETPSEESVADEEFSTPTGLFESPRKAPQPPVFDNLSREAVITNSDYHSSKPSSDFKNREHIHSRILHSRESSIGNTSSIYTEKKHSRNPSSSSFANALQHKAYSPNRGHSRNNSDLNVARREKGQQRFEDSTEETSSNKIGSHDKRNTEDSTPLNRQDIPKLEFDKKGAVSPERRTVSAREMSPNSKALDPKRVASAAALTASTTSRATGSNGLRNLGALRSSKSSTSAFQEGIRNISTDEAIRTADFSGWMSKRGNLSIGSWKQRYFTLHKTRLSYFGSLKDKREKGLIDITSHRVLPAVDSEDKISAVYAATTGSGRFCFKLVPPAPGSKKGLTFTQQKVHYFAVDTKQEMRDWMAALMKATIELDESVPVISSCVTPTIPLHKAQELLAQARENARVNLENLEKEQSLQDLTTDEEGSFKSSVNSNAQTPISQPSTQFQNNSTTPTSLNSTNRKPSVRLDTSAATPDISGVNGLSTPYLVTSGLMSPNSSLTSELNSPGTSSLRGSKKAMKKVSTAATNPVPMITKLENEESSSYSAESNKNKTSSPSISKR
ncbi:hypothetical protein OGAPHI_003576 [Ogataea philodendri]|uniref:Protein BOI2 n=1 Tax=Ogataea philodendri TaxID=1378263 RepID=A0A9P8P525_9ASCO|nr:uncharacterized protein OGAPHI_003576 [Ogataea philodendri]KAH3665392.1 hypothetical protein OGAPHI_003576 [Ogataea philodendri]